MNLILISFICAFAFIAQAQTEKIQKSSTKPKTEKDLTNNERKVASNLQEIMQAEVSDDSVGVCHVRLVRLDFSLEPFEGPELVKEACFKYGRAILNESDNTFKAVIIKHNGLFKNFER